MSDPLGGDAPKSADSMKKVLEVWMDSETKVRLLVFFRQNPGLVETIEGLARRLGTPVDRLSADVRQQVELGLLREKNVAGHTIYLVDRDRWKEFDRLVEESVALRLGDRE